MFDLGIRQWSILLTSRKSLSSNPVKEAMFEMLVLHFPDGFGAKGGFTKRGLVFLVLFLNAHVVFLECVVFLADRHAFGLVLLAVGGLVVNLVQHLRNLFTLVGLVVLLVDAGPFGDGPINTAAGIDGAVRHSQTNT